MLFGVVGAVEVNRFADLFGGILWGDFEEVLMPGLHLYYFIGKRGVD